MPNYKIDPSNSKVSFYASYLVIAKVKGDILSFNGNISSELEDLSDAQIEFTANVDSINTGIEERDNHIKSDHFLNADKFPLIKFISTSIEKKRTNYLIKGVLRIKETSKEVEITANYNQKSSSFDTSLTISRNDYNLKFDSTVKGNHLIGDEIKVFVNVEIPKNY